MKYDDVRSHPLVHCVTGRQLKANVAPYSAALCVTKSHADY
eukprot:gene12646-biopygen6674